VRLLAGAFFGESALAAAGLEAPFARLSRSAFEAAGEVLGDVDFPDAFVCNEALPAPFRGAESVDLPRRVLVVSDAAFPRFTFALPIVASAKGYDQSNRFRFPATTIGAPAPSVRTRYARPQPTPHPPLVSPRTMPLRMRTALALAFGSGAICVVITGTKRTMPFSVTSLPARRTTMGSGVPSVAVP